MELLQRLSKEEDELWTTVIDMISSLSAANHLIASAENEKRKLEKRIRNLRNQKQDKPLPGSDKDNPVAVKQLPAEVWEMIFDYVSNPIDLWSCSHVCRMFDEILGKWKARHFLEQALPHLPKQKVLECRLVSKGWNVAVNSFLENHPSIRPPDSATSKPRILDFVNPVLQKDLGRRNVFGLVRPQGIPHLDDPNSPWIGNNRNPFIGRYVVFNFWREDVTKRNDEQRQTNELELFDKMCAILKAFGAHIWYLSLMFPSPLNNTSIQMMKNIFKLLTAELFELVPNLRKLRLGPLPTHSDLLVEPSEFLRPAPKLESIELVCGSRNQEFPLFTALLIRDHAQLGMLVLNADCWKSVSHLSWPNLSALHLKNLPWFNPGDRDFSLLTSLCEGSCPRLERLGVDVGYALQLEQLLKAVNKIVPVSRLKTLRLDAMHGYVASDEEGMETVSSSYAPMSLITLEIDISYVKSRAEYFNFLARHFPLLQNLNIFKRRSEPQSYVSWEDQSELRLGPRSDCQYWSTVVSRFYYKEIVDVGQEACSGDMYSSRIWELLPRLEVLTFQTDVYTRFGYECFSSKRFRDAKRDEDAEGEEDGEQDKIASEENEKDN